MNKEEAKIVVTSSKQPGNVDAEFIPIISYFMRKIGIIKIEDISGPAENRMCTKMLKIY